MHRLPRLHRLLLLAFVTIFIAHSNIWIYQTFQIFAAGAVTSSASISAGSQVGSNGWYVSGVTVTIQTDNQVLTKSITYYLDNPANAFTVNTWQTTQTFSQNGQHTLYFYATDTSDVQETPIKSISFKIDTVTPYNWQNFTIIQDGNNHTFDFKIDVADAAAGLNPAEAYIQYSTDAGATYGYWSPDLTKCNNGTFQTDQWYHLPNQAFVQGAQTGTITTPAVDVCNSNFDVCKIIRFRIFDMAGNKAEKQFCLYGAWMQTKGGDIYSKSNITMNTSGAQPNASYIVGSGGTIANFSSASNWYTQSYNSNANLNNLGYAGLYPKIASKAQALPGGKLSTTSGYYKYTGDLSIDSNLLPGSFSTTKNFATVLFVSGTVTINTNIVTDPTSVLVVIANGAINVHHNVTTISGIYIAGGQFDSAYNGGANQQLQLKGSVLAQGGILFSRSLGKPANSTTPAELFVYQPQYLINADLVKLLSGTLRYDWREAKP